jgi:hypothetical protein
MTVSELRKRLLLLERDFDDFEVVVWLPGSYVKLSGPPVVYPIGGTRVIIEGNLEPGSALEIKATGTIG